MKLRGLLVLIVTLLFSSCGLLGLRRVELPSTPLLTAGTGWGLVKSSYVRIKSSAGLAAQDVAALRDGSLVMVVGREYAKDSSGLWYRVSSVPVGIAPGQKAPPAVEGWVPESELTLYESRSQAERANRLRAGS